MAGRVGARRFSDDDKAAALAALAANGNNLKRTARELSVNVNSLRRWRDQQAAGTGVSDDAVDQAVGEFVDGAEKLRDLALMRLTALVEDGAVNARDLITTLGVLDDKITRAKGLPTQRTEHLQALPPADELRTLMTSFVAGAIEAAGRRHDDIVEAEIVQELPLLPASTS